MQLPQRFSDLPEYAFPRLRRLLHGCAPGGPEISMSIGEPRHPVPALVAETIAAHAGEFGRYPPNEGTPELRTAIADWLALRYGVAVDPETEVVSLNGSREGLFNAALALSPEDDIALVGRGKILLTRGQLEEAMTDFTLALKKDPEDVDAYVGRGDIYLERGDLEKAIDLDPTLDKAYGALAVLYFRQGRKQEGCYALQQARDLGDRSVEELLLLRCDQ